MNLRVWVQEGLEGGYLRGAGAKTEREKIFKFYFNLKHF